MKKFLQNTRWAVLWGLFLVILHLIPGRVLPQLPTCLDLLHPDKLIHLGMFAMLVFLSIKGFVRDGNPVLLMRHPVLAALLLAFLLGVILELAQQYLITNRYGSVYDLIANGVGCLLGWGIWKAVNR